VESSVYIAGSRRGPVLMFSTSALLHNLFVCLQQLRSIDCPK
jgi:hypothetical protein